MRMDLFPAKITAKTFSGGKWIYSWEEQIDAATSLTYTTLNPSRKGSSTVSPAYEINNSEVAVNTLVWMRKRAYILGQEVFEFLAPDGTSTGNLTVEEVDGSPSLTNTTTLRFDQADGFVVSQPASNIARVDLSSASATQKGAVDTTTQTFAGAKTFTGSLTATSTVNIGASGASTTNYGGSGADLLNILTTAGAGVDWHNYNSSGAERFFWEMFAFGATAYCMAGLPDSEADIHDVVFAIRKSGVTYPGDSGTDALGNTFVGGICTDVGAGTVGTGTVTHTSGALTDHCVVVGNGSDDIQVIAAGTDGQILTGQTGGDPLFKTVSGDATFAAGGGLTIANNTVTYAKMQDVSAGSKVLGRNSGSGDPEELSLSTVLDFIGSATQGDILYRGASAWARLGYGTSGQHLTTGGAGANPAWVDAVLSSTSDVTFSSPSWSTNGTYVSCSCSISLDPGTWLIMASILGHIQFSTGASGNMQWRVQNTTDTVTIIGGTGNAHYVVVQPVINEIAYDDDTGFAIYTIASGTKTIALEVTTNTATVWTSRDLDHAELVAIKIT